MIDNYVFQPECPLLQFTVLKRMFPDPIIYFVVKLSEDLLGSQAIGEPPRLWPQPEARPGSRYVTKHQDVRQLHNTCN